MKPNRIIHIIAAIVLLTLAPVHSKEKKKFKPDGVILHTYGFKASTPYDENVKIKRLKRYFHYIVLKNGTIIKGAPTDKIIPNLGNHLDSRTLWVLVQGNYGRGFYLLDAGARKRMPSMQEKALKTLLFRLMNRFDVPLAQIERYSDHKRSLSSPGVHFPYFKLLHDMSTVMIKRAGRPLLADICRKKGVKIPIKNAVIIVDKSDYKMKLYAGKTLLKTYSIGLSSRPKGDKRKKGDRKTPTGTFYISEKYPMRAWMEISYPGIRHAKIGLKKKIINEKQYKKIVAAAKAGGIPCHGTPMGDDVGIHAGGFPYGRMRTDSTAGCISMEDPESFELYYAAPLNTKVIIKE